MLLPVSGTVIMITITITMTVGLPLPLALAVAVLLVKHGDGGSVLESTQRNFRDRVKFKLKLDPAPLLHSGY